MIKATLLCRVKFKLYFSSSLSLPEYEGHFMGPLITVPLELVRIGDVLSLLFFLEMLRVFFLLKQ